MSSVLPLIHSDLQSERLIGYLSQVVNKANPLLLEAAELADRVIVQTHDLFVEIGHAENSRFQI